MSRATPAVWVPSTLRCSAWRAMPRCLPARRSVARPLRMARTSAADGAPRRFTWTRPVACAASPSSAARVSLTTRAVLRPSTTRTICAVSMPTVSSCRLASPLCGATCWLAPRWSSAAARAPWPIPRLTRPPNPTSLWAATSTPAPALPSMPLPPATRLPCPSIALCSRAPRSPSAATSAATPRSTATMS